MNGVHTPGGGMTRRGFLGASAAASAATVLGLPSLHAGEPSSPTATRIILLFLTGGPSHLDTFDPKPNARSDVRGPFGVIPTRVPGINLSELLPHTADQADKFALIRSVTHSGPPIHETGQQLLQTGQFSGDGVESPHFGSLMSHRFGPTKAGIPPFVILPRQMGYMGFALSHGQGAGLLGAAHAPVEGESLHSGSPLARAMDFANDPARQRYGNSAFGAQCLRARRLLEAGVRCVTVNMFESVYGEVTWDCHGGSPAAFSTLDDYRRSVCPAFDYAYAGLLQDLAERGLLASTLVVALGEFGRSPILNAEGGRDHWPGVWSILLAGGGIVGGQVVGSSDALGAEPRDRPLQCAEVFALIQRVLGLAS